MLVGTVLTEIQFYFYFITPGSLRDVVLEFGEISYTITICCWVNILDTFASLSNKDLNTFV